MIRLEALLLQIIGFIGMAFSIFFICMNGTVDNINKPMTIKEKKDFKKKLLLVLLFFCVIASILMSFTELVRYGFCISYVIIFISLGGIVGKIKMVKDVENYQKRH